MITSTLKKKSVVWWSWVKSEDKSCYHIKLRGKEVAEDVKSEIELFSLKFFPDIKPIPSHTLPPIATSPGQPDPSDTWTPPATMTIIPSSTTR